MIERSRFKIIVTESDIANAKRNNSYECVVAHAIARAIPDATRIDVDSQSIRFTHDEKRLVYLTPYAVQGYVIAFDAGDKIVPFGFHLRQPVRVKRKRRTAAGRAAAKASRMAKDATEKRKRLQPSDDVDPRAAARAAYAEVRLEQGDLRQFEFDGVRRPAPRRVFKRKTRTYGYRMLRINKPDATAPAADDKHSD